MARSPTNRALPSSGQPQERVLPLLLLQADPNATNMKMPMEHFVGNLFIFAFAPIPLIPNFSRPHTKPKVFAQTTPNRMNVIHPHLIRTRAGSVGELNPVAIAVDAVGVWFVSGAAQPRKMHAVGEVGVEFGDGGFGDVGGVSAEVTGGELVQGAELLFTEIAGMEPLQLRDQICLAGSCENVTRGFFGDDRTFALLVGQAVEQLLPNFLGTC